jgi:hypothetical protein
MSLGVVVHRLAKHDMAKYVAWLKRRAPITTARWFANLKAHILGLADKAGDCPRASEHKSRPATCGNRDSENDPTCFALFSTSKQMPFTSFVFAARSGER